MKILSWNINGLISWIENQSYRDIENFDADVVCLQEIRTKRRLTALSDYCHYWNPCERDGMHGTMTLSKQEPLNVIYGLGVEELDKEGRVLTIELATLFVVNCYAPRAVNLDRHNFRRKWDNALRGFVKNLMNRGKQVVLCGDFNVLRTEIDIYPENEREFYAMQGIVSEERSNIEKLLEVGFIDAFRYKYPNKKNSYTFWSNRKHKREENRGWRLDYFFVSKRAKDAINDIKHLTEIQGSDHAPILLDLDVWFTDDELVEEWKQTDWILAEKILEQHQQALTRAMIARNFDKIAKIQTALVNHPLIKRMAVRQVGERTNTAGIDNVRWYTASDKMRVAKRLNKNRTKQVLYDKLFWLTKAAASNAQSEF